MAVKRWELWNPPSGSINAAQRTQALVGYSSSALTPAVPGSINRWEMWSRPSGSINASQRLQMLVGFSRGSAIPVPPGSVSRWEIWNAPTGAIDAAQRSQFLVGYSRAIVAPVTRVASAHSRSGKKGIRGTQWETCSRCARDYPLHQVAYQNGVLVCKPRCWDNPAKLVNGNYRERIIADILSQGAEQEGMDLRFLDEVMANQGGENW